MDTSEVLKIIEGLSKRELYYWEEIRLISPKRIKRGKVEFREYSEKDLEKIQMIYKYVKQGFTPKVAAQKANEENQKSNREIDYDYDELYSKLTTLKLDSSVIQYLNEKAVHVLSNLKFDLLIPIGKISLMIAGGLSSACKSGKISNFEIMEHDEKRIDGETSAQKTAIIIHDGEHDQNSETDHSRESLYSDLISMEQYLKSRNIRLARVLLVFPHYMGGMVIIGPDFHIEIRTENLIDLKYFDKYFENKHCEHQFLYWHGIKLELIEKK